MNKISFCYIIDDNPKFKDLLIRSLYSLIKYYKDNIDSIYILTTSLISDEYRCVLNKICRYNKLIIKNINIEITNCIKYPEDAVTANRVTKSALLKFFIPYLVDCDKIYYVDCDIVFYQNIFNNLIKDTKNVLFKLYSYHFFGNSGLIYLNCEMYRNDNNIFNEVLKYYNVLHFEMRFVDQSCFYYLNNIYNDLILVVKSDSEDNKNIHIDFNYNPIDKTFDDYKDNVINELYNSIKDNNYFIFHAMGEKKIKMIWTFDEFIKDDQFNNLNYKDLYFKENSNT